MILLLSLSSLLASLSLFVVVLVVIGLLHTTVYMNEYILNWHCIGKKNQSSGIGGLVACVLIGILRH